MPHGGILADTLTVFGIALVVTWLFRVARAPAVIGFLTAGVAIGPAGLGLVESHAVGQLAEIGLVLLLFTVGLELSTSSLVQNGRRLVVASALQIGATVVATAVIGLLATDWGLTPVVVLGLAVALSSTAIALKHLSDRQETGSVAGNVTTGVLLLQDVFIIVVMMALPIMGAVGPTATQSLQKAAASAVVFAAVVVAARYALPSIVGEISRRGGREMMTLFAVVMACGGAWLAGLAGWSWALGSCVAGLLLAETDVRHQLAADIIPFRDVFNALFFISLGMLVDMDLVVQEPLRLVIVMAATLAVKAIAAAGAVTLCGWPVRIGVQVGLGLCTVSEFSYVLAAEANAVGLLPAAALQWFILFSVGTMVVGALLLPLATPASWAVSRLLAGRDEPSGEQPPPASNAHVIIVGYGLNGQNLARVLRATAIPFCVIEANRSLAQTARQCGAEVLVGDAARGVILDHAGLSAARALVVTINDPPATRAIVSRGRTARSDLYILVRTRFVREIDELYRFGASMVIPEEFETSVEIFSHVLHEFAIPDNVIEAQVAFIRAGRYAMLRGQPMATAARSDLMHYLEATATQTYLLGADSPAVGRDIRALDLRAATGVTIIAVVRGGRPTTNPPPEFVLEAGDVLVMVGGHRQVDAAKQRLAPGSKPRTGGEAP